MQNFSFWYAWPQFIHMLPWAVQIPWAYSVNESESSKQSNFISCWLFWDVRESNSFTLQSTQISSRVSVSRSRRPVSFWSSPRPSFSLDLHPVSTPNMWSAFLGFLSCIFNIMIVIRMEKSSRCFSHFRHTLIKWNSRSDIVSFNNKTSISSEEFELTANLLTAHIETHRELILRTLS